MTAQKFLFTLCALPALALAQSQADVGGPVAGFVFDPLERAIRPMFGVAGAAYLGPAAQTGLDAAAIAPDGNSALVVHQGRLYRVTQLRLSIGSTPQRHAAGRNSLQSLWTPVEGALAGADRIVWQGSTAAVYSSSSRQAQVLSNLSQTPSAGASIDLSSLPGNLTALAVNGDDLLVGIAANGVYRLRTGAPPQFLAPAQYPAALRVAGAGLYFADRDAGQVWQIADYASGSTPIRFAGDLDSPVALHLSANRLFVASAGGRTLTVYSLATHTPAASLDLAFTPSSLDPMGSTSLLLMATAAQPGQPFYVVDTSPDPTVYFVPSQGVQQ